MYLPVVVGQNVVVVPSAIVAHTIVVVDVPFDRVIDIAVIGVVVGFVVGLAMIVWIQVCSSSVSS